MSKFSIKNIDARTILDSRGEWTVEVRVESEGGSRAAAAVPQGKSTGSLEAYCVEPKRAVKNVLEIISSALRGADINNQEALDKILLELDGTDNKSKLGANAILGTSLACARVAAIAKNVPLWKHILDIYQDEKKDVPNFPRLYVNVINGGLHAGNNLDIQEYHVIPKTKEIKTAVDESRMIYFLLREALEEQFGKTAINIGDEGGFAPNFENNLQPFELLSDILNKNNLRDKIDFGIDAAANNITNLSLIEVGDIYLKMINDFNLLYIEDPFLENDFEGFSKLVKRFGDTLIVTGDDLTTTNVKRMDIAKEKNSINGIIIKPNQIGTLTETLSAIKKAREWGWKVVVSHRSGETNDDFIADLSYAVAADGIKLGAPARGERIAKYNRLLEIEKEAKNF